MLHISIVHGTVLRCHLVADDARQQPLCALCRLVNVRSAAEPCHAIQEAAA